MNAPNSLPDEVVQIMNEASTSFRRTLERVYFAGLKQGSADAEALKRQIASVIGASALKQSQVSETPKARARTRSAPKATRAPLGTARPAITSVLQAAPEGLDEKTIFEKVHAVGHTAIKRSTIHSTLNKMRVEEKTEKVGRLWRLRDAGR